MIRSPNYCAVLLLLLLACNSLTAAPPKVNYFLPPGAQRGQTVIVTGSGEFSTWPVQVWADQPGVAAVAEAEKGKFKVTVAADATPGVVWLRAYNEEGAAQQRPFVVGTVPEVEEVEPNDSPAKAQVVAGPIVVNGRLSNVDAFAVRLKQGQTLVASLLGHQVLGSPMDAVLQVCEIVLRRGKPEAFVLEQNHDAVGLDPQLAFVAPRDGNYVVRIFAYPSEPGASIGYAGGDNFLYRLTLTTGGFINHALPLAIQRGQPRDVRLFGWNLPQDGVPFAATQSDATMHSPRMAFNGEHASVAALTIVDLASIVATPTTFPAAQEITLPVAISGSITREKQVDRFKFAAKKDVKLRIATASRKLGFPLLTKLKVFDEAGKQLAAVESANAQMDAELIFTPPADGNYVVSVADLFDRVGLRFVYLLTIAEPQPEFGLQLAADNFVLKAGTPLEIPVTIAAPLANIVPPLNVSAVDLPTGVKCELVSSPKAELGQVLKLVLHSAAGELPPNAFPIRIRGTSGGTTRGAFLPVGPTDTTVWITPLK